MRRIIGAAFCVASLTGSLSAQRPSPVLPPSAGRMMVDPLYEPGRNVTISLLTMGNGEAVWEMFGHTAIWIHDDITGRDSVFNWGEFDFREEHFILHFMQGLNIYWMGGQRLPDLLAFYQHYNRSVDAQELNLSSSQKDTLLALIRWNAEPEHLRYRYDYFVDNCATRPRDLLDRALGGQLQAGANIPSGTSYRYHTLRLMQGNKPLVLGVDIGLGEPSDREITKWQEMFLPRKLHDWVAGLSVRDSTGAMIPLVRSDRMLFRSTGGLEPPAPPSLGPWLLGGGLVLAVLFLALGSGAGEATSGRRTALAVIFCLWASVAGILGVILTLLWTVTDHVFAYRNENLLLFNPLWLILAVSLPFTIRSGRMASVTRATAIVLGVLGLLALVAHGVGLSGQVNLPLIGLALPPLLAILWSVLKRAPATRVD